VWPLKVSSNLSCLTGPPLLPGVLLLVRACASQFLAVRSEMCACSSPALGSSSASHHPSVLTPHPCPPVHIQLLPQEIPIGMFGSVLSALLHSSMNSAQAVHDMSTWLQFMQWNCLVTLNAVCCPVLSPHVHTCLPVCIWLARWLALSTWHFKHPLGSFHSTWPTLSYLQ